jgi:hypothetical protein
MTRLFSDVSISVLSQLLFIVILNLIPLLIWAAWDLEQRRRNWLSRRQGRDAARRRLSRS